MQMEDYDKRYPAIVLSLYEPGLAFGRGLGRNRISVYALDFKKRCWFLFKIYKS